MLKKSILPEMSMAAWDEIINHRKPLGMSTVRKRLELASRGSGRAKTYARFRDFLYSESIQRKILAWRTRYGIPMKGLPLPRRKSRIKSTLTQLDLESIHDGLIKCVNKELLKAHLHPLDWEPEFSHYFFHNIELGPPDDLIGYSSCLLLDETQYAGGPQVQRWDKEIFPIVLRISPYASMREIIDYLKALSHHLEDTKNEYKRYMGRLKVPKRRPKERRDARLLELRLQGLSSTQIIRALKMEFPDLDVIDQGQVHSIVQKIKRRRAR